MAELELETIDRAVRWCAEAGRQTTPGEIRAALGALGWDQLLAVRALLADPPPTRPLGPHALADLARGVPPDVAAEREREQRYPPPGAAPAAVPAQAAPSPVPSARKRAAKVSPRAQVVVRKAVVAAPEPVAEPARLPLIEQLLLPAGRGELERLIRTHGGRRPHLIAALAAAYRRADGAPIGDADLDAALEHHGLDRAFTRRERDELVHAVRAAGAVLARAAAALGHDLPGLQAAIARLGADAEVRRLREARQRDLRARATLSERAGLLTASTDMLADLGVLEEFERDLKGRLPEHLRALSTTGEPLEQGLARSMALPAATVRELLTRLGVELRAPPAGARAPGDRAASSRPSGVRPSAPHPSGLRPASGRPTGSRTAGSRRATNRTGGARPSGAHPASSRPAGSRPAGGRPTGSHPTGSRPTGGRPTGGRPTGGRPTGGRPTGGRPAGDRPGGGRPAGPRRTGPGGGRRGPNR